MFETSRSPYAVVVSRVKTECRTVAHEIGKLPQHAFGIRRLLYRRLNRLEKFLNRSVDFHYEGN